MPSPDPVREETGGDGVVYFARCPEHGLHGERTECFVCGKPVEQVPFVPAASASSSKDEEGGGACRLCRHPLSAHVGPPAPPLIKGHLGVTDSRPGSCLLRGGTVAEHRSSAAPSSNEDRSGWPSVERVGELMRQRREQRRLGLWDAAEEIGVSFNTLSRLERGRPVYWHNATRILDWLGYPAPSVSQQETGG